MKNKNAKRRITGVEDGFKQKHFSNGKLMHVVEHLITYPTVHEVCYFGSVSVTANQIKGIK